MLWEDGDREGCIFFHSECLGSIFVIFRGELSLSYVCKWFRKWLFPFDRINRHPFKSWKYLPTEYTTSLFFEELWLWSHAFPRYVYLRYAFLRYAFLRYAFLRYAYLRYAFLRYDYLRYAYLRYDYLCCAFSRYAYLPRLVVLCLFTLCLFALCLSAFWLYAWYLSRFCPPASVGCIHDLEHSAKCWNLFGLCPIWSHEIRLSNLFAKWRWKSRLAWAWN